MSVKVAAIMPLFNKAEYVKETIDSILKQSYASFDLIIIDDASQDESIQIVKKINDPRIKLFENKTNSGTSEIGNQLFEKAKNYNYAIRCDADDIFELDRFEKLISYMECNTSVDICSSNLKYFGNQTGSIILPENNLAIKAKLFFTSGVSQGAAIFRMSRINNVTSPVYKNKNSNVGEDWMLFVELSSEINFGNVSESLVNYRIHDTNITNSSKNFFKDRQHAIHFVMNYFDIPINLETAYLLLMGITPEHISSNIKNELKQLVDLIKNKFENQYQNGKYIDEELKNRIPKAICIIADKKAMSAIKIHYSLKKYSNTESLKYCLIKLFKK